jgi:hypothetical protein
MIPASTTRGSQWLISTGTHGRCCMQPPTLLKTWSITLLSSHEPFKDGAGIAMKAFPEIGRVAPSKNKAS